MNKNSTKLLALFLFSAGLAHVDAGVIQIGDFRMDGSTYGTDTFFDPGFSETTRDVLGAPVNITSAFAGTSEEAGRAPTPDVTGDTDIGLRTWSSATRIYTMNRYTSSSNGGVSGVARIGAVQWSFNLTPLDSYLSGNGLTLTALDLDLVLGLTGSDPHDVYLSYTDATAGTTLTGISATDSSANYYDFWWAANGATVGDFIGNKFEVLQKGQTGNGTVSDSLLTLYNSGVREFSLSFMTGGYSPLGDITNINDGSGLSITTIPEPAALGLVGVFGAGLLFIRRHFSI